MPTPRIVSNAARRLSLTKGKSIIGRQRDLSHCPCRTTAVPRLCSHLLTSSGPASADGDGSSRSGNPTNGPAMPQRAATTWKGSSARDWVTPLASPQAPPTFREVAPDMLSRVSKDRDRERARADGGRRVEITGSRSPSGATKLWNRSHESPDRIRSAAPTAPPLGAAASPPIRPTISCILTKKP
eukprot:scaffold4971_cov254-Pinguiococcus_pyrenoidosus.AAC.14